MKDGTKNIIAACILTLGIIVAVLIYVNSTRYEYHKVYLSNEKVKIDKITGKEVYIDSRTGKEIK